MSTAKAVLEASAIYLKRSETFALDLQHFAIKKSEVVCVAGANGSGKTTLLDVLVKLLFPDRGTIRLMGESWLDDDLKSRMLVGFIPDDDGWIISELTAREYFALMIGVYKKAGMKHDMQQVVTELAEKLLFNNFDQQMGSLSHGNKKKVQIIAGLLHKPKLLIVDELRNGLDPIAIKRAEDLLKSQAKDGVAVLAATHDLWWAERFANKILMLQAGKVILEDDTPKIVRESGSVEAKFLELFNA